MTENGLVPIAAMLLIIFALPGLLNPLLYSEPPPIVEPPITPPPPSMKLAITYAMTWWQYDLTQFGEASTTRDFKTFAQNGIRTIVICPIGRRLSQLKASITRPS
jgi:hypothetical protein